MTDRARLVGETPRGFRVCVFPCQKIGTDGQRVPRLCSVSVDPAYQGKVWQWSGSPDAPTLTPSINCGSEPCWHGFIINGEVSL